MIDVKELRLHNIVEVYGKRVEVSAIAIDMIYTKGAGANAPKFVDPISLSNELLIQCGFEKDSANMWCLDKLAINMPGVNGYEKGRLYFNSWFIIEPPKYLHQLQNIHYALYQTELTLQLI